MEIADPGDTIVLEWACTGTTHAILYKLFYSGQLPADGWYVPPTGSYTYTISEDETNWVSFMLFAYDEADAYASAGETVELRCQDVWFFAPAPHDICPTAPVVSWAAEQNFERGVMIWIEAEDAIYVLYDSPQAYPHWDRFPDEWDLGEPESDPSLEPPPGLQQPVRGFGLVWREQDYVREQLGWAVEQEQGYRTVMQRTTRYKYNSWYLLARDGGVWYLGPERSEWDKISPTLLILDPRE